MTDIRKQKKAYALFTALGLSILLLTLFEIALGQEAFLLLLFMILGPLGIGFILGLCALAVFAVSLSVQCKGDPILYYLGAITIPFTLFAVDNVLYIFDLFVVANDTVEVVSIVYSIVCIAVGILFSIAKWTPKP
ncbi:hypothetical protein [Neptunomonas qingdaonensis]|uniref:Uncharacterized protein n=1 Tax=Neptunomonas qingdaonensis TaxID=1045558 RepID=A0A1I2S3S5_9GAMM|nr:hypothetical protein [Neptunomonas qingdaonensis]SFG47458.1 hypothetical protein SAMN05216175_107100 [Neptunomonas qingdaonensis]